MTQEEKAKAYDEALKKIQPLYEQAKKDDNPIWSTYEHLFPELRESEDEKIRRELIEYLRGDFDDITTDDTDRWITWIEKQKEQKPETFNEPYNPDDYEVVMEGNATSQRRKKQKPAEEIKDQRQIYYMIEDGRRCGVIEGRKQVIDNPEKYGLQKPAKWSEEDEMLRVRTINRLETLNFHGISGKEIRESIDWLKSLRPQPKADWSEEDELMRTVIIQTLERFGGRGTTGMQIAWLKSLPERFNRFNKSKEGK